MLEFCQTALALLSGAALLVACNSTAGVGQDISQTGKTIERTAVRTTP